MLIVSTRNQFTDPDDHRVNKNSVINSECRNVNLRTGALGAKVSSLKEKVKDKKVLLLIHGYNSAWNKMLISYDILESNFRSYMTGDLAYDYIIGFAWAGGDHAIEYLSAKERAKDTIPSLAYILDDLRVASILDVECHSLGCYLALGALGHYSSVQDKRMVRNLILLAAAIDNEGIQKGEQFYNSSKTCEKCIVFHSKEDRVLRLWYPLVELDAALGYSGPEDIASIIQNSANVKMVNCSHIGLDHSDYKHERKVYEYIRDEWKKEIHDQFHTVH